MYIHTYLYDTYLYIGENVAHIHTTSRTIINRLTIILIFKYIRLRMNPAACIIAAREVQWCHSEADDIS